MRSRILKLFLILCMVTALLPLPHFSAVATEPEPEPENLVRNGDFENASSMKNDWGMDHGEVYEHKDGEKLIYRKEVTNELPGGRKGYALKIVTTETKKEPWFRQRLYKDEPPKGEMANKIIPGATYKLSYSIYAELEDCEGSAVPGCYLIYYSTPNQPNDNSSALGNRTIAYTSSSTNNLWTRVEGTFQFPSNAVMLCILMQSNAKGTVYFDDISLELVEVEKFEYNTSHMFHYTGEKEGKASVTVSPFYQGTGFAESVSASFGVYDGKTRLAGADNVRFTNEEASFTYLVDVLKEKGKKYTLSVSVKDSSGAEVGTFTQSLYRYDRPNFLDADGNFRNEDGEVVNPFIAWNLRTEYLDEAKKAGCTMSTMDYEYARYEEKKLEREAHMKAAKEAGIYGLFALCIDEKLASDPEIIENTKKIVEEYANDRSFVGWFVKDEPLGGAKPEDKEDVKALLELAYKTIRDIDPNHPVILTDYHKEVFKETTKYCDIFITDSYGTGFSNVRSDVEEAVKYSNGRPVWTNINAYTTGAMNQLPSGQQVQHFIHQAFLGGAKGVSVYEFNKSVANPETPIFKTPIWNPLVDTGNTEIPVLFDLFVRGKDAPECKEEPGKYVQRKWTRKDGDYYFLMSLSKEEQTVGYDISEGKAVKLLGGDSVSYFTLSGNNLSVSLKGGDVLMFKVFDKTKEAQITDNSGIGIKTIQTGNLTYTPPTGAAQFAVALYKKEDGKEKLAWICWYTKEEKLDLVYEYERHEMTVKVFAWDDFLKPIGKAAVVPPVPDPSVS